METKRTTDRQEADCIYTVRLEGMEFFACHGVLESERREGNHFKLDFEGKYRSKAGCSDALEDALDYGEIYKTIAAQMNMGPFNLLETLCFNIRKALIEGFPHLESFRIRVAKEKPPVEGPCAWSSVESVWQKETPGQTNQKTGGCSDELAKLE